MILNYNNDDTASYNQQERLELKKIVSYNNKLISYFKNIIILNNTNYKFIGIVTTTNFNHYNGYLINLESSIFGLNSKKNYYYDSLNIFIISKKILDLTKNLFDCNPYIFLYIKD